MSVVGDKFIRILQNKGVTIAIEFEPYRPEEMNKYTLKFTIATATALLGFDEDGKLNSEERYMYLDENGNQVEHFEDALKLATGSIFPSLVKMVDEKENVNYFISFYSTIAMFKNEVIAFTELIISDLFYDVYTEFCKNHEV